jgi:hypothetical protein
MLLLNKKELLRTELKPSLTIKKSRINRHLGEYKAGLNRDKQYGINASQKMVGGYKRKCLHKRILIESNGYISASRDSIKLQYVKQEDIKKNE